MLNVAKYIVQFYDNRAVRNHIVDNVGGNSIGFMRDIMGLEREDVVTTGLGMGKAIPANAEEVATDIRKYGIGLVSTFAVEPAFQQADGTSYDGALTEKSLGQHAMAVVGHRKEDNKHYFLLQNWWIEKQFVEVSQDYLASSGASVSFVTKAVSEIPINYPTVSGAYSLETEDLGDHFELEMRSL
ncbi:hypothetical protein DIPPA_25573 [Diplonema papillatum]|nr:hypothetical protein DIPPA_25573 [Diplonema papillatum]